MGRGPGMSVLVNTKDRLSTIRGTAAPRSMGEVVSQPGDRTNRRQEPAVLKSQAQTVERQLKVINTRIREMMKGGRTRRSHAVVNEHACVACGVCEEGCPEGAITIGETAIVDQGKCTGCGQCADVCPEDAISLMI